MKDRMTSFKAVTLHFPLQMTLGQCKQLLSKFIHRIQTDEKMGISYRGAIIKSNGRCHCHLTMIGLNKRTGKTLDDTNTDHWCDCWRNEFVQLPKMIAADFTDGWNIEGWEHYIFIKNTDEAEDYKSIWFNKSLFRKFAFNMKNTTTGESTNATIN